MADTDSIELEIAADPSDPIEMEIPGTDAFALVAEGFATGSQDGTPVQQGSPYWHNNAKWYKEQAEQAATEGADSAQDAAESAAASLENANRSASLIEDMTVAAEDLQAGSPASATVSEVDGHKHILFGIPLASVTDGCVSLGKLVQELQWIGGLYVDADGYLCQRAAETDAAEE